MLILSHYRPLKPLMESRQDVHIKENIWHRDFGCNIQVKRYESHRILGLSVTINDSSILFINVYFPVACHEKNEEHITCISILSFILESHEEDHVCILGDFNATPGSPRFNEICDMHMRIM